MNRPERDKQFLGFARGLQLTARQRKFLDDREVSAGKPLDITDMLTEARRKREAGETYAEFNSRMLRRINRNNPHAPSDQDPRPRDPMNLYGPHRGRAGE